MKSADGVVGAAYRLASQVDRGDEPRQRCQRKLAFHARGHPPDAGVAVDGKADVTCARRLMSKRSGSCQYLGRGWPGRVGGMCRTGDQADVNPAGTIGGIDRE